MAKEAGLGQNFYFDEYDLSNDTNSFGNITKSLSPLDFTGIDKSAFERKAGQLDAAINIVTFHNPTNAHAAYKSLPRTDRIASVFHRTTIGAPVASLVMKQVGYNPTRDASGALTAVVEGNANADWLDWGVALTAGKRTDTTATNGASFDNSAAQAFGLQAYLHVFSFTGTSVTVTIQDSADNASFAAITGGAFTAATGATKERIATSRTGAVRRYLRVATSGTFSSAVFAVSVAVNIADMTI